MLHKLSSAALALLTVYLCCCSINLTNAQENIQLQVPPSLVECYNTSYFMNRDNRLPSNIETLITLIEKVENYNNNLMDMRQMAVSLLHRFRQDGIQRAPGVVAAPGVLPYSPTGFQFPKFRILLSRLIPGNALNFPNNTLTREERCSLHFMLSSSFDTRVRGDENQVCNRLSQYRAQRIRRSPRAPPEGGNNFLGDVELFDAKAHNRGIPESGRQMRQNNPDWTDIDYGTNNNNDQSISQCPVENGVIWTPWGSVTAGTVIAGIAAGLQQQNIQLRTLLALSSRPGMPNSRQTNNNYVDNRWASTLAGDLAEVALVQMPVSTTGTASVGANGAWNSTVMAKWYFLSQRQNLEMTDAEIRGGLDGLILAMNISSWNSQASNLKLSQVLRMYYSTDGVLGSGIMACNRKANFQNVAPYNTMVQQSAAFAQVLDREMQLRVTLSPDAIYNFSTSASNALVNYVPNYLNDISCTVSNPMPQDVTATITPMTNIYVFLDTTWQYYTVVDYLIYVLQRLNINPYASSVTLLAANDGSVIVNTTNYLSDIYEGWNVTTQSWYTPGFNLPNVLRTVQNLTQNYMNAQQANNTVGGRSMVALIMPYMTQVADGDSSYAQTQLQYINEQIPDLRFIYFTGGTVNRFQSFVQDPSSDLFALSPGQNVAASAGPVVNRIKQIPRRLINPACGSAWYTNQWNTYRMNQFARPGVTNFYRMAPNYFYGQGSNRVVTVNAQYSQQFTICTSRYVVLPTSSNSSNSMGPGFNNNNGNNGNNDIMCQQITGSSFSYDLSNACNGYSTIGQCPPLYLSVQAPTSTPGYSGTVQTVSCSDPACQTPDQATYIVSVTNLGCYSGVAQLVASLSTLLLAILALQALH